MPSHLLSRFGRTRHLLLALALTLLALLPSVSFAQSACTAVWGIVNTAGGLPARLAFYNNSAGTAQKFTTLSFTLGGTAALLPNALAGDPANGTLYYFERNGLNVMSANLNTQVTATIGTIAPVSPDTNASIIGAVIDSSSNLIMMSSSGAAGSYHVAIVNKGAATTTAVWRTITYLATGGLPTSGGSGDLFIDKSNQLWLLTNSNPTALYPLTLTITAGAPGTITAATVGASVTYALGALTVAGAATDPLSGQAYFGGSSGGSVTYAFLTGTPNSAVLTDASPATLYGVTDMGNCVLTPAAPTITKSITPTFSPLTNATATLLITIGNTNSVPIWLTQTFVDTFPTNMVVAATPNLTTGACVASTTVTNVITATAGAGSASFAVGGRIPAGGCTISFTVAAPAATNGYTNTIAAGGLATSSGGNPAATSATYKVGTDFASGKSQCVGVCGTTSTSVVTIPGGKTVQYVLTITNSAGGGTGSVTFTDTLPSLMTPVLSITSAMVGGGSCATATAVVGGATIVTGTVTNALADARCTITVTSLVSATQSAATNVTNTVTLSPLAGTSDTNGANNTATVPTIVGASANLSVVKSNGVSTVTAGSTISYTITVANIGPGAAPGTTLIDPLVSTLNCTAVTCTSTAANMCPASPTIGALQGTGLQVTPTFAINTTASFVVTCGVTATGQ